MRGLGRICCVTGLVALLSCLCANADVKMEEKSQMRFGGALGKMMNLFGGKAAKEGVVNTVAVKGERKATFNELTGEIVDLSEEKVYELDMRKKTYRVLTFDQIRRRMQEAREKAEEETRKASKDGGKAPEMEVEFAVKETGQTKAVGGYNCREVVATITVHEKGKSLEQAGGLVMTSNLWLASEVAAAKEIADFDLRYAQKLQDVSAGDKAQQMAQAMAMYPGLREAFSKMNSENANLSGAPMLTTMTVESMPSKEQTARQAQEQESEGAGGLLGGFARRLGRKKSDDQSTGGAAKPNAVMTATNEVLKISTSVSPEETSIPAGFKLKD